MKTSVHKIMEIDRIVWVDNQPTNETEKRTLVCFVRETDFAGIKTVKQFGSLILNRGVTVEQAEAALKDAPLASLKFCNPDDKGFYKVVL